MWRRMGITRNAAGLDEAAAQVDHWCRYVLPHIFDDPAGWTMQNMLITARLMIAAATERKESRGCTRGPTSPRPIPPWSHHVTMRTPSTPAREIQPATVRPQVPQG